MLEDRRRRAPLNGNRLTGRIPSSLRFCQSLYELRLHANQLTGPVPEALAECKNLKALTLQDE